MAEIILGLMGGLGLFLFGMKQMSDGLEKAAGAKMRSILEFFTKTPLRGILVGTFFTAVIQSSSAATVMVVSFVNSGPVSYTHLDVYKRQQQARARQGGQEQEERIR